MAQQTTQTQQIDRSALFTFYNKARAADLDTKRTNKALGILQAGALEMHPDGTATAHGSDDYTVTRFGCDCPDHAFRQIECKHMIARWLYIKIRQQ